MFFQAAAPGSEVKVEGIRHEQVPARWEKDKEIK